MRQFMILVVALYSTRVVLQELGVEDFGIYGAITGMVAIMSFLPGALAQASQRFFAFALGEGSNDNLVKLFSINFSLYFLIALLVYLLLQTFGLWFMQNEFSVDKSRYYSANLLYQYVSITVFFSILTTPYISIIIANEDMSLYAYISIFESLMKFGAVCLLQFVNFDKLELYGILVMSISILVSLIYMVFCYRRYNECRFFKLYWDPKVIREILKFTGWTLFGGLSTVTRTHGITLLLNQAFNPAIIAARTISVQISSQVNTFANNFNSSITPPIIKSFAAKKNNEMYSLINLGSKISFYLMWIISLPFIVEMQLILELWLVEIPKETAIFAQLSLVEALILSVSFPLSAAARATGKVKYYELILGSMQFSILILAWFFIEKGMPAYSVLVIGIMVNLLMLVARLILVEKLTGFSAFDFMRYTVLPILAIIIFSSVPVHYIDKIIPNNGLWSISLIFLSFVSSTVAMYFIGLNDVNRTKLKSFLVSRIKNMWAR